MLIIHLCLIKIENQASGKFSRMANFSLNKKGEPLLILKMIHSKFNGIGRCEIKFRGAIHTPKTLGNFF